MLSTLFSHDLFNNRYNPYNNPMDIDGKILKKDHFQKRKKKEKECIKNHVLIHV